METTELATRFLECHQTIKEVYFIEVLYLFPLGLHCSIAKLAKACK